MPTTAVMICDLAHGPDMDRVLGAMGEGYGGFENGVGLAAISNPTVKTHTMLNNALASESLTQELVAMASSQDLPSIDPLLWGVNGTISAQDAQAAMLGFTVLLFAGSLSGMNATQQAAYLSTWRNNELAGLGLTMWQAPEF